MAVRLKEEPWRGLLSRICPGKSETRQRPGGATLSLLAMCRHVIGLHDGTCRHVAVLLSVLTNVDKSWQAQCQAVNYMPIHPDNQIILSLGSPMRIHCPC